MGAPESSAASRGPVVEFDHHDPSYGNDPERFAALHAETPVFWTRQHGGYWVVTSEMLCRQVLQDWQTYSSAHSFVPLDGIRYGGITIPEAPFVAGLVEHDPPRWHELRHACAPLLSGAAVGRLQPFIESVTESCIDRRIESGSIEFVRDLAGPVPAMTTLKLVGLPLDRWRLFADTLHAQAHLTPDDGGYEEMMTATALLFEFLYQLVAQQRRTPRPGLISRLIDAGAPDAPLTDEEIVNTTFTVVAGGIDTTTSLISHAISYLGEDRSGRDELARQPGLLRAATEEFLRYFSPAQQTARTVTRDTTLGNASLRAGDRLLVSLAGANHDAAERPSPARVELARQPNRHAAFGLGIHTCLGARLARAEFDAVLRQVLDRMPNYEVMPESSWRYPRNPTTVNGWVRIEARFPPASRRRPSTADTPPGLSSADTAAIAAGFAA